MASQPVYGVVFLKIDGAQYQLRGNLKVDFTTLEADGVAGQDGVHGYGEKPVCPEIECELSDSGGLDIAQLQAIRSSTITAELSNGKVALLESAWTAGRVANDTTEGKINLKFQGMSGKWI